MKRLLYLFSITAVILMGTALTATAQNQVSWEIRGGANIATGDIGEAELNTGYGVDGMLAYWFMPYFSLNAGWGWHQFSSEGTFAGSNMDFRETGYTLGLEFTYPLGDSEHGFYLRGAGTYNKITAESTSGDISFDSEREPGWQAGTGLAFHLGSDWVLKPGIRYRSLSGDFETNDTTTEFDLTYLNFSLGLTKAF